MQLQYSPTFLFLNLFNTSILALFYLVAGIGFSYLIDFVMSDFDKEKNRIFLALEVFLEIILTIYAAYWVFKLGEYIPDFTKLYYKKYVDKTRDIRGGIIITFTIFIFQEDLRKKILHVLGLNNDPLEFET